MKLCHGYHDAELSGTAYSRANASILLNFELVNGDSVQLLFSGVEAFRINDFGLQNVVSRILASPSYAFSINQINEYVSWAHSKHDYKASFSDQEIRDIGTAVERGELTLFVLEPSVGAEIVILCERALEAKKANDKPNV